MKLYTFPEAPSPRRVHLFLAEKGLEIETELVDLRAGEHLQPEFLRRNPRGTVPVLELDDGTCLSECTAICRYIEEIQPEPVLFGETARERGLIADRNHWVEMNGLLAVMEAFRNALPGMKDRGLPGPRSVAQIPELAERGRERYGWFLQDLDAILNESTHVAGDRFSVVDISALVTVDFATRGIKAATPESLAGVQRWYRDVSSRPAMRD